MESSVPDFVLFVGRFHPLVVHFPIGFIFFAFILELYTHWKKESALSMAIELALLAGAISAAVASILGYMLSLSGDYDESTLDTHFWFGIVTTMVTFIAWAIRSGKIDIGKFNILKSKIAALTLVVVLVGVTGHYGGNLTHGSDYLVKYAPFGRTEKVVLPPIEHLGEATVYDYLVNPILDDKCIGCHNSSKKKGGLSLQDSTAIMRGGKNGEALIAGNAQKSEMIRRIMLDPQHDDFMPPEGKTPLTDEEKSILSFWIEKGNADFKVAMADLETSEEIISIASLMLGLDDKTGKSGIAMPIVEEVSAEVLKDIVAAGFKVRELVYGANVYEIVLPSQSVSSEKGDGLDVKLQKLLPIKNNILWLSLKDNSVQDRHMETIGQFKNLQKLEVEKNPITDAGVGYITSNESLTGLNLYQTQITASSFDIFAKMKALERVYVWGTAITEDQVAKFKTKEKGPTIILGM